MDFIKKRRVWYTISLIVIGLGLLSTIIQGLNLGIDFTGGTIMEFKFDKTNNVTINDIREVLDKFDLGRVSQVVETKDPEFKGILIRTTNLTTQQSYEIEQTIKEKYSDAEVLRTEQVGPSIGKELRYKAILALIAASIAIVIYISLRFRFQYAIAAIVALLHDTFVVIGLFSIFGLEVNTPFIAAILTIIGYSINDTIVIFDRIRENVKLVRKVSFEDICNKSVIETLPRSINTSVTTLLTVLAILLFGGISLKIFMMALLFGIIAGAYSSIFIAAPLLVTWKKWVAEGEKI